MAKIFKPTEAFDMRRKEVSEAMNLNGMEAHKYNNFLSELREQVTESLFVEGVYREMSAAKNKIERELYGRPEKRNGRGSRRYRW